MTRDERDTRRKTVTRETKGARGENSDERDERDTRRKRDMVMLLRELPEKEANVHEMPACGRSLELDSYYILYPPVTSPASFAREMSYHVLA